MSFFSSFLLLRQLIFEQGVDGVLRLVHDDLGYDHVLRAEKLQGQLYRVVLRPADAPVGELADQHAAALHFGPHDEVERPVAHLLAYARFAKTLHGLRHGCVGRKKKILAVVVVSLSADLYVLAMVAMVLIAVDVLIILIHNCLFFVSSWGRRDTEGGSTMLYRVVSMQPAEKGKQLKQLLQRVTTLSISHE